MSDKVLGIDVTSVLTSAEHELGLRVPDPANPQNHYVYVQADDAVAQYDAVTLDFAAGGSGAAASVPHLVTPTSAATSFFVGVAQVAIAAGSYGFILVEGEGIVQAETAVAQGDVLAPSAVAGELITQPSTAANPTQADFDSLVATGRKVIATEAEGATTAGFASILILG